jgi:hypothetical protein
MAHGADLPPSSMGLWGIKAGDVGEDVGMIGGRNSQSCPVSSLRPEAAVASGLGGLDSGLRGSKSVASGTI